jgi:hypothetical protein
LGSNGRVKQAERDAIMRQQVILPETPRQRRELAALEEELGSIPLTGKPLPRRLRNFRSSAEAYLASTAGPLPYMLRLHAIELQIAEHEDALESARRLNAKECRGDELEFSRRWRSTADRWSFDEINDLIERHIRWYPAESRLPMDPQNRRLRPRQRPGLPAYAARLGLGARAVPAAPHDAAGRRALTSASIAGRSASATSRSTRSAFSTSSPGRSATMSCGV